MLYDIPMLPEITIEIQETYEYLTNKEEFGSLEFNSITNKEYKTIIFLVQTHLFLELANDEFVNEEVDKNYIKQAFLNYEAFKKYFDQ